MKPDELSPPVVHPEAGWETRFIGSEPRLSEVAEMYREIGFEVRVEPFDKGSCSGCCTDCFTGEGVGAYVVYTREVES